MMELTRIIKENGVEINANRNTIIHLFIPQREVGFRRGGGVA